MIFLIAAAVLGLIPAWIASSKGHSFFAWWICGAGLFIIALPASILIGPANGSNDITGLGSRQKKCPFCAEMIRPEAKVCRYCHRDLPVASRGAQRPNRIIKPAPRYRFRKAATPAYNCPGCNGPLPASILSAPAPICPHCHAELSVE
jgi:hypothetical protein